MRSLKITMILWVFIGILNAQDVIWEKTFGGSDDDGAGAISVLPDGNIILAGVTESFGAGLEDVYVIKIDKDGNKIWEKTFGGSKDELANAVSVLPDGNIILARWTKSFGAGGEDVYVIKIDKDGHKIWEKTFGGSDDDGAGAVSVLPDGNIILAGGTYSFGAGRWDVYVIKIDKNGNKIWEKTFGGSNNDWADAVSVLPDGNVILAGWTWSFGAGLEDVYVIKIDKDGNKIWEKTFGGKKWDGANAVSVLPDGNIILAGYTNSFGAGSGDVYVIKIDKNGNKIWEKTFGGSDWDKANAVSVLPDGNIILAGGTYSFGAGGWDVYVLKLNAK